jgi:hypothetical protein
MLLGFSVTAAGAQSAAQNIGTLALGTYVATVPQGQKPDGVDLTIKDITPDGRITGTVREHRGGPMCGMPMPANGLLLKDGDVRIEVSDGAPAGCERTYLLKRTADGRLTGEAVRAGKTHPIQFARR